MIKPKVKVLSDDGKTQVIELAHPSGEFKAVIFHAYGGGRGGGGGGDKIDVSDETVIRELWKRQYERHLMGAGRTESAPAAPPVEEEGLPLPGLPESAPKLPEPEPERPVAVSPVLSEPEPEPESEDRSPTRGRGSRSHHRRGGK